VTHTVHLGLGLDGLLLIFNVLNCQTTKENVESAITVRGRARLGAYLSCQVQFGG